jgi:hypothetical protein
MFSITRNRQDPGGELTPFVQNSGFGGEQPPGSWRNGRFLAGWGEEHPSTCNIEHELVRNRRRKGGVFAKWRGLRRMAVRNIVRLAVTGALSGSFRGRRSSGRNGPLRDQTYIMESRTDAHYTLCAGLAVSFLLERGQRADTRACGKGRCRMQVLATARPFRYRRRIRIQLHATFATRSATDNLRALRTDH